MPRAHSVNDATVLKLTLFALLERYSTFDRRDLDEMNAQTPTPSAPADEIMDAIKRVRIDGRAVGRIEGTIDAAEAGRWLTRNGVRSKRCAAACPSVGRPCSGR